MTVLTGVIVTDMDCNLVIQVIDNILKQTFVADAQYFYEMTLFGKKWLEKI